MSHRLSTLLGLAALSLLGAAVGRPALAADLDYGDAPPPVAEQNVEFGSGWYIRGDLGATRLPSLHLNSPSNLPTQADPSVIPDAPSSTVGDGSKAGYVASLGAGYQFNSWIRSDVIVDFRQPLGQTTTTPSQSVFCPTGVVYPDKITNLDGSIDYGTPSYANGGCTGTFTGKLQSYDALVNGYVDLGTWNRVTPYLGAGVGVSFGHYHSSATYVMANSKSYNITYSDPKFGATYSQDYDRQSGSSYQTLAWALMGGFSIDVFDHTKLDIGYRYLSLGAIPGLSGTLTSQEVHAGLRYMVDN